MKIAAKEVRLAKRAGTEFSVASIYWRTRLRLPSDLKDATSVLRSVGPPDCHQRRRDGSEGRFNWKISSNLGAQMVKEVASKTSDI